MKVCYLCQLQGLRYRNSLRSRPRRQRERVFLLASCYKKMDWGITLLGDPDISYLSQNHAVAHVHSDSLCVYECVCVHLLSPTASVCPCSCSYYKAVSISFALLSARVKSRLNNSRLSRALRTVNGWCLRFFLPYIFSRHTFVKVTEEISTPTRACLVFFLWIKWLLNGRGRYRVKKSSGGTKRSNSRKLRVQWIVYLWAFDDRAPRRRQSAPQ